MRREQREVVRIALKHYITSRKYKTTTRKNIANELLQSKLLEEPEDRYTKPKYSRGFNFKIL